MRLIANCQAKAKTNEDTPENTGGTRGFGVAISENELPHESQNMPTSEGLPATSASVAMRRRSVKRNRTSDGGRELQRKAGDSRP